MWIGLSCYRWRSSLIVLCHVLLWPCLVSQSCKPVTIILTQPSADKIIVSQEGKLELRYPRFLGTSNFANVNGALGYVASELIDLQTAVTNSSKLGRCARKRNIGYLTFYKFRFCNPDESLWWFSRYREKETGNLPRLIMNEYGPFLPMDQGICHEDVYCEALFGSERVPPLGQFIGFSNVSDSPTYPTEGAYMYSVPGECPLRPWTAPAFGVFKNKTDDNCYKRNPSGECPAGVQPDGSKCTWGASVLGQVDLDDLVGIRSIKNNLTGKNYKDYNEFCKAGGIEFLRDRTTFDFIDGLEFWKSPLNREANKRRIVKLVETYHNTTLYPDNLPLPPPALLRKTNPPCYQTASECGDGISTRLCRRDSSQYCQFCELGDNRCEPVPEDWENLKFPVLDFSFSLSRRKL